MDVGPGLDNKIISGWNGLTLTGILEAYQAIGKTTYLTLAKKNYNFILKNLIPNPNILKDMEKTASRILSAIKKKEKIASSS